MAAGTHLHNPVTKCDNSNDSYLYIDANPKGKDASSRCQPLHPTLWQRQLAAFSYKVS
jgi:hypothetical protein